MDGVRFGRGVRALRRRRGWRQSDEATLARLDAAGWEARPEVSFSVFGERGSIDVLAYHRRTGSVLVVEVKSVVPDLQAMLSALDRKARLAGRIAAERGWAATSVSRLLVIRDDRTTRRRIESFGTTFRQAVGVRGWAVDRWIRAPDGTAIAGLRFLSDDHHESTRHRITRRGPVSTGRSSPDLARRPPVEQVARVAPRASAQRPRGEYVSGTDAVTGHAQDHEGRTTGW